MNISNIRNNERKRSSKTINQIIKSIKIFNDKKSKPKTSKFKKNKKTINNSENNYNNINNNNKIIINKKKLQQYMINDKFEQSNEKDKITSNFDIKKHKKSNKNLELKQIKEQKTKKRKKQFCCPFLLCLKMSNNEENENESII